MWEKKKQKYMDMYVRQYICPAIYSSERRLCPGGLIMTNQRARELHTKVRLCRVCRATATHKSIYTGKCRLFEEGSQSIVL